MKKKVFWGRGLVFYPWTIEAPNGARLVFLNYAKALREAGLQLDCVAPSIWSRTISPSDSPFDRILTPRLASSRLQLVAPQDPFRNALCEVLLPPAERRLVLAAATIASSGEYDVVAVNYTRYAPLRKFLPDGVRTILFTHELDSAVAVQEDRVWGVPPPFHLEDEVSLMRGFDAVTVVGPEDARRIRALAPELNVLEAAFCPSVEPRVRRQRERADRLLLVCSRARFFDLSFLWFYEHVWPMLRARRPETKLTIAGGISDLARSLGAARDPNVDVLGVVDDVDPLYEAADVFIAPYYYGDGIKTKIIETMSRGLPVVTTPPGLSNTRLIPGIHLSVAGDAREFAGAVIDLLDSPERRDALSRAALDYVTRHHSPSTAYHELREAVRAWAGTPLVAPAVEQVEMKEPQDIQTFLRHLVPWTVARCAADRIKRVAIFGTGGHSRVLLPMWRVLGGPTVSGFIVSGQPASPSFLGLPVASVDAFDGRGVDGIILSSQCHEQDMALTCRHRWPEIPCYSIWIPQGTNDDPMFEGGRPKLQSRIPPATVSVADLTADPTAESRPDPRAA